MTSSGKRPAPLGASEVRGIVLEALLRGTYRESLHARFDHVERKISFRDVAHGLGQPWHSCSPEEFNEKEWQWKYKIETVDTEGKRLTVIIAVDARNKWFQVVTRFHERT